MGNEKITDRQSIAVIVMYITGTSSLVIFSLEAKKDLWLGILICYLMAVLMALAIARIKYLFPEDDIFQIFEKCFGKILSKFIIPIYLFAAFYISVLINTFLIHFIRETALPNTPKTVLDIFVTLICIWMVKEGMELISRFAAMALLPTLLSIVILILLLAPVMNFGNLLPAFEESLPNILSGSLSTFVFPLGELIIFPAFFKSFSTPKSSYKVLLTGLSIGALVVLSISVSNVLVLGIDLASDVYYPTYISASRIVLGTYLHGLEMILSMVFILGAFIKTNVYFLVCCKGISRTFGFGDNYKFLVTPVGIIIFCASLVFYDGPLDYTQWLKKDLVPYSIPYLIVIPIITYIVVEIRKKKIS